MRNDSVRFNEELNYVLAKEKITFYTKFDEKHAPLKSKRIMYLQTFKKSNHEEVLSRKFTDHSLRNYKKQNCSRLYEKERKNFFNKLNTSSVSDNKLFWKNLKTFIF